LLELLKETVELLDIKIYEDLKIYVTTALLFSFQDKESAKKLCSKYIANTEGSDTCRHYQEVFGILNGKDLSLKAKYTGINFIQNIRKLFTIVFQTVGPAADARIILVNPKLLPEVQSYQPPQYLNLDNSIALVTQEVRQKIFFKIFNDEEFSIRGNATCMDPALPLPTDSLSLDPIPPAITPKRRNSEKPSGSSSKRSRGSRSAKKADLSLSTLGDSIGKEDLPGDLNYFDIEERDDEIPTPKARKVWTEQEVSYLIDGVKANGVGKWTQIEAAIKNLVPNFDRTRVDLKDKWRNMVKKKDPCVMEVLEHFKTIGTDPALAATAAANTNNPFLYVPGAEEQIFRASYKKKWNKNKRELNVNSLLNSEVFEENFTDHELPVSGDAIREYLNASQDQSLLEKSNPSEHNQLPPMLDQNDDLGKDLSYDCNVVGPAC
jgi:hypothetical protein